MDGAGGCPLRGPPAGSKAELEAQAGVELAAAEPLCCPPRPAEALPPTSLAGVGSCGRKVRWGGECWLGRGKGQLEGLLSLWQQVWTWTRPSGGRSSAGASDKQG